MAKDAVFRTTTHVARELTERDIPRLQALFDANPTYFELITGEPPRENEAREEFDELPPAHLSPGRRWVLGLFGMADDLSGVIILVKDLGAPGVWHVALFLLDSRWQGSGLAQAVHDALQSWARTHGAEWLRLGVVVGNARAERFWQRCGYVEVRRRSNIPAGGRTNDVRVMVKPLAGGLLSQYLIQVPRDQPGSSLP